MTARSEVTPELIERLLPAYRRLRRMAREDQAAAETPPGGQEKEAACIKAAPPSDMDLHRPEQGLVSCPPPL